MSERPAAPAPGERSSPPASRAGWVEWLEQRLNLTEIVSFITHFGLIYTPMDVSRPVREVLRDVARQPVTAYARGPRVLGLLAAILFGLEVLTGVLLAYYYRPTPEAAYESARSIVRDVPAGWFVHQMHAWGALLLIAIVVLRLLRLFWDGLYRAPREVLWWTAVAMTWIVLQLDFTGHLLAWDSRSYWGTVRGLEVIWALPLVGPVLAFLLGGRVVNDDVLIRFYVLHLMVLPAAYAALIYLTFATLRRIGLSAPPGEPAGATTTFRNHLISILMLTLGLFAVLVTLATLTPFRFLGAADPYATPPGVGPPWYMLAPYALLHRVPVPGWLSGLVLLAVAFAVLLLPLAWRGERGPRAGTVRVVGTAAFALWVLLTVFGVLVERGPR